jgi:glutaredoxin
MNTATHRVIVNVLFTNACLLACLPAWAQFKVVAPDGSVTYTDRQPAAPNAKVTALGRDAQAQQAAQAALAASASRSAAVPTAGGDPSLPIDLRPVATRYPVVLYTTADCAPCDSGRVLLQQRGIPYTEKRIGNDEDAAALERKVGGRMLPALTVGAQALRGLTQAEWTGYLDAAGYPKESRLPRNWQPPAPTPLTERAPPAVAAAPAAPVAAAEEASAPVPINPPAGVRF